MRQKVLVNTTVVQLIIELHCCRC